MIAKLSETTDSHGVHYLTLRAGPDGRGVILYRVKYTPRLVTSKVSALAEVHLYALTHGIRVKGRVK